MPSNQRLSAPDMAALIALARSLTEEAVCPEIAGSYVNMARALVQLHEEHAALLESFALQGLPTTQSGSPPHSQEGV